MSRLPEIERRTHPRYETSGDVAECAEIGYQQGLIIGSRAQTDIVSAFELTDTFVRSAAMVMTPDAFQTYRTMLDAGIVTGLTGCEECDDHGHNVFIPCVNG